jgi:hypothetical protein
MIFCACSMPNAPAASESFTLKRVLGAQAGCGDVTSLYKNRKTNFLRQAIQEPIFSVAYAGFEGGDDGRGRGVRYFVFWSGRPNPAIHRTAGESGVVVLQRGKRGLSEPAVPSFKVRFNPVCMGEYRAFYLQISADLNLKAGC